MPKYKKILKSKHDQRLFSKGDDTYIVDHSGDGPDTTDDGPLRFAADLHDRIVLKSNRPPRAVVKVYVERNDGAVSETWINTEGALVLARRHGFPLVLETYLN